VLDAIRSGASLPAIMSMHPSQALFARALFVRGDGYVCWTTVMVFVRKQTLVIAP